MHLFLNCLAATAGGGLTYVRSVIRHLAKRDVRLTVVAHRQLREGLDDLRTVTFLDQRESRAGSAARWLVEQRDLPELIRQVGADLLISAGNVGLLRSPVPEILLSQNALYTSPDFRRDLLARGRLGLLLNTLGKGWLVQQSIRRADRTVVPSEAFARELRQWVGSGARVVVIPHGFDHEVFLCGRGSMPAEAARRLATSDGSVRLLFVSYYNYFRDFETLIRALPLVKQYLEGRRVSLVLTCELRPRAEWGPYDVRRTAKLARRLGVAGDIVELGLISHAAVADAYRACDIYVTASYAETFAFPLVEAMASGLPVVASDLAVHQEVCRDAALYFQRFSPAGLAEQVVRIVRSPVLREVLAERGRRRSADFSWERHVTQLLETASDLLRNHITGDSPGRRRRGPPAMRDARP